MRSKYVLHPTALPHPLPLPSSNRKQATVWPPVDTQRRDRHSQPQHANLPATTAIYTATLEQSAFQFLVWKTNLQLKMLIAAKLNENGKIGKM